MTKKLKILFTHCFGFGGGLIITHSLCNHLVGLGHDVICIYIKNKLARQEPLMLDNPKYKVIWLESLPMISPLTLNKFLKSYLRKNHVDVIVSTGPEGAYLKTLCSKKSIVHLTSYHHPNPTYADARVFLPNLKCLNPRNIGKWFYRWSLYFERLTVLKADVVHCLSKYQKNAACKELGVPENKIVVIYCGVNIERFVPDRNIKRESRILYCGGLVSEKGIDVLLKAFSRVIKKHDVSLDILGDGNWEPYSQKAMDLGIADKVHYRGYIANDQIGGYYKKAYLFVAPTKHESFGLTIAEAMAAELPVVSTLTTAIPEVVEDSATGILVPWNNVDALANAIILLLNNPKMVNTMGKAGRKRVEQMFTWKKTTKEIENLIIKNLRSKESYQDEHTI
ncbi:D-inositol-3-phosphate glycosyltransferase [subsurface metagenome]